MIHTYRRIKAKRANEETEEGFTLIELLVVIVVLGILAAVVIIALGGITGKSAVAACQADGATVETAITTAETQNPAYGVAGVGTATITLQSTDLLSGGALTGDPYLGSWPSNAPHYAYTMNLGALQLAIDGGAPGAYLGPTSCIGVI